MSLDALPNEILLKILKDMYPPGAFEYWAPYGLKDETLYPPHTYQTPGWKPSQNLAYTEFDRCRQYFAALNKADMAVQSIASMNHHLRGLSRDVLILRATYKVVLPSLSQLRPQEVTWGMLVGAQKDRDASLAIMLAEIVEEEKLMEALEEESTWRAMMASFRSTNYRVNDTQRG